MILPRFAQNLLIFAAISMILAAPVSTVHGALNLPSTTVNIEVRDSTQSYFNTTLSEVPSGYNVTNSTYLGWSVDSGTPISRSPATHPVRLYSSLEPPAQLANQSWGMVNYILNHKQGSMPDIQQAIWYFVDIVGNYTPTRTVAWEIVNDTLQKGEGFIPTEDQTVAVICYPVIYSHQVPVQISIIEIGSNPATPEFPAILVIVPIVLTPMIILAVWVYRKKRTVPAN